jgi:glucoamylase
MTFNVNASTYFGENVYLSGNTTDLGAWRPADALPGSAEGYSEERPLWTFEVELPQGIGVEYRYVRKESDGSYLFEERNRTLEVPFCTSTEGGNDKVVEDAWVGPVGSPS